MSLTDQLTSDEKKNAVIEDCLTLIDREVADKRGAAGIAIKLGYKTVKNLKPGFLRNVVRDLLPEFAAALDPIYADSQANGSDVAAYFTKNSGRVADALLSITDAKADRSTNRVVRGAYSKLRSTAKKNVEDAVPRLGELIQKHAN